MSPLHPSWPQPSHPLLLEVIHLPGTYTSLSRSLTSLPPGALLAHLGSPPLTRAPKAYSTVQVSATQHIELNCDFLYTNHSCEPSVEFHVVPAPQSQVNGATSAIHTPHTNGNPHRPDPNTPPAPFAIEVRVAQREDASGTPVGLTAGEELTFFYPSTEWEMAQPFACRCGTKRCAGRIRGAREMGREGLGGRFVNEHVWALVRGLEEREKEGGKGREEGGKEGLREVDEIDGA